MPCPHCAFEVAADFQFCPKCGKKLSKDCPKCAYVCPPDFLYCPKCGTEVSPQTMAVSPPPVTVSRSVLKADSHEVLEAERRPVTVLFSDVVGFTSLAEKLDPEELRSMMMGCFQALAEEIRRYEGFIEKFIGDAILAVFGAPVAHEDDPERAVQAALGMQTRLQQIRASTGSATAGALTMRIGINTGLVVAGTVGEGKDYGVVGDAVNVAARVQQNGAPGQVTVSEETYRLIRKSFECRPLGTIALKGKTEPIQTFEVVGPVKQRSAILKVGSSTVPLIGRREELNQFVELFTRARKGKTQVVSLIGEAGIGKSRLLDEFLCTLDAADLLSPITLYRTDCSALGNEAYHVFIDFFRTCFALTLEDNAAQARRKIVTGVETIGAPHELVVPVVEHLLGFMEKGLHLEQLDPEQLKRQLFLAVKEICQRQSRQSPILFVVENFQWADAASAELLRSLVDRVSDQPLMLLLIARPTAQMGPLYSANVDSTVMRLQPLTTADSEALFDALSNPLELSFPPALRELVTRRADGNPFFLEEAIHSLSDTGVFIKIPKGVELSYDLTNLEIPATVQGVILARLDSLESNAKQLLLEAAVIGTSFDLELLRQITTRPRELQTHIETLLSADLFVESPGTGGRSSEYRFRNALIQEVAYNRLLKKRRAALHGTIASTLERLHRTQLDDYLSQLAHHYSLSDDQERALHYLLRSGDKAARVYANQDAVSFYRRALVIVEQQHSQPAVKADVLEKLADAHSALGEPEAARESWEAALLLYETLQQKQRLAAIHRKIGLHWWSQGDREQATKHFQRGLQMLTAESESVEAALLYQELGRLFFRTGDDQQAIEWAQKALALGQRLGAPEVLSLASNTLGVSMARRGELEEGVAKVEESLQVALQHDLLVAACRAYTNLGMLLAAIDRERALSYCHDGLALAKKIGDLSQQSWLYASMSSSFCSLVGDCSQGIEAAEASIALDLQLGQRNHLPIPLILLAQIYQCQDQLEESQRYYIEACTIAEESGEPQLLFPCYDGLATLYLAMKDIAKAEEYLAKSQEVCQQSGYTADALIMLPFLC